MDRVLTIAEVKDILGVSQRTAERRVRSLCEKHKLSGVRDLYVFHLAWYLGIEPDEIYQYLRERRDDLSAPCRVRVLKEGGNIYEFHQRQIIERYRYGSQKTVSLYLGRVEARGKKDGNAAARWKYTLYPNEWIEGRINVGGDRELVAFEAFKAAMFPVEPRWQMKEFWSLMTGKFGVSWGIGLIRRLDLVQNNLTRGSLEMLAWGFRKLTRLRRVIWYCDTSKMNAYEKDFLRACKFVPVEGSDYMVCGLIMGQSIRKFRLAIRKDHGGKQSP
jgi:hypothetical protein